jgi:hypothetical protein
MCLHADSLILLANGSRIFRKREYFRFIIENSTKTFALPDLKIHIQAKTYFQLIKWVLFLYIRFQSSFMCIYVLYDL